MTEEYEETTPAPEPDPEPTPETTDETPEVEATEADAEDYAETMEVDSEMGSTST